jgi:hypothetical protein
MIHIKKEGVPAVEVIFTLEASREDVRFLTENLQAAAILSTIWKTFNG